MMRDDVPAVKRRAKNARRWANLRFEALETRRVLSAESWVALTDLAPSDVESFTTDAPPVADPLVLVKGGQPNTDAASLLAAGGPGDTALPGFANVARSGNYGTVVYLGNGWAITANHVGLTSTINFGGTSYTVDMSSVRQLHNPNNSLTDLKMFRLTGEPNNVPELLSSYIATGPPQGHVFMIGNGLQRGDELFWSVNKTQSPWVWTQISEPARPNSNNYGGVSIVGSSTIRWGENTVNQYGLTVNVGGVNIEGFTTVFDYQPFTGQTALPYEAQGSAGDSGGAVFSYVNGKWVLSGLMIAVSGSLSGQPSNTALYGNVTLMVDLSAYRNEILSIVGVVDRQIFYNASGFDGGNSAINAQDDLAIATDKAAYLPDSGLATFNNVTSYVRGINGIMIDLASTHGTITANDFTFKVGASNTPDTWQTAPAPTMISVRTGAGAGGSDRVEIVWANSAIVNTWLEVTLRGNDAAGGFNTNTGLEKSDVFYFGNRIGDAGQNPSTVALTNAADEIAVRNNFAFDQPVTNLYDVDRNGLVNISDQIITRSWIGFLPMINVSTVVVAPQVALTDEIDALRSSSMYTSRARLQPAIPTPATNDWQLLGAEKPEIRSVPRALPVFPLEKAGGRPPLDLDEPLDLSWLEDVLRRRRN